METERLPGGLAFSRVFEEGRSTAGRFLVLYAHPGPKRPARVGFAVGKRLGGAVVRNRIRRRMREAFRNLTGSVEGLDLVFVARGKIIAASHVEIQREMRRLLMHVGNTLTEEKGNPGVKVKIGRL